MGLARHVAEWSKDRSTKVGAVVVGPDHEIRSIGYNGFPRGIDDDNDARHTRPLKYKITEHAERNAVYNAVRMGTSLKDCTMYVPWGICTDCARAAIQSGIIRVVISRNMIIPGWEENTQLAEDMLIEAGIRVQFE